MNKITDKTTNKTMDKTTNKIATQIATQITMLGTGNATISQINTDFLFGYLGGILLPIMARMNLCKSVESVGLFNGEFYQLNRLNPVGKFRLFPALRNQSWR
jgi:hypothetical protein